MTTIRKIVTSKIDGNQANVNDVDEIRPFGETAFYLDSDQNPDVLSLMMFNGVRTHVRSKVLRPGVLYGSNEDSSDGLGYDTIKLIPDSFLDWNSEYTNDQYIIIEPTGGEPGHVHIRSGGTMDQSSADLFLGGELNHVKVSDTNDTVIISTDAGGDGATHEWTFSPSGHLQFPGGSNGRIGEDEPGLVVYSDTGFAILTNLANTENSKSWIFNNEGGLTFPNGGTIEPVGMGWMGVTNGASGTPISIVNKNSDGNQRADITLTNSGPSGVAQIVTINAPGIPNTGNYNIVFSSGSWDANPLLGLSTTGGSGDGLTVNVNESGSGYADFVTVVNPGTGYLDGETITVTSGSSNATFVISVTEYTNNWAFDEDGALTFPDTTVQTTAWTGVASEGTTSTTSANVGYIGMPQNSKSTSYTLVAGDQGKHIYVTAAGQTITVPSNETTAFPIGTTIAIIAGPTANPVSIAITSDTMYLGGVGSTGTRTLAAYGMATLVKVAATTWFINGSGLS